MSTSTPRKTVPRATLSAQSTAQTPARFNSLASFKLDVLASLMTKHGELLYQRLFGLRIVECRVLGVVAHFGPVTLRQTCLEVGIDKGQGSRLVAQLLQAGLLDRRDDPADQRSFYLLLSPAGQRLHDRIVAAAAERNQRWMGGLSADQRAAFVDGMATLTLQAQAMLAEESARAAHAAPPVPLHEQADPVPDADKPLIVAPAVLRDLHRRLGQLLGDA